MQKLVSFPAVLFSLPFLSCTVSAHCKLESTGKPVHVSVHEREHPHARRRAPQNLDSALSNYKSPPVVKLLKNR